ncbi:MAG: sugar ABC transporter permease [Clostridiales bacterium]|nr:sugar ABC transporter permease [Clostridiales bacterium]
MASDNLVKYSPPLNRDGFMTLDAVKYGDNITRLSALVFGLGSLLRGQLARFIILMAIELGYIIYMIAAGGQSLVNLGTLGTSLQNSVYDESLGIYVTTAGDNSMLFLLYGVITLLLTIGFFYFMAVSLRCAYVAQKDIEAGEKPKSFNRDLRSMLDENLHKTLMTWPILGILVFTIVPLVFMILIAFTNYDRNHQVPGNLFDWVGLANFQSMLSFGSTGLGRTFFPVLGWTLIWAIAATFSNYVLGMLLAILINREGTRGKGFWRFMFVLSIAMPAFISLMTMRTIFANNGPFNLLLQSVGIISQPVTWWGSPMTARIMIIVVNIWIGIPYTMLTTTGILQNIPAELYESARVDGASPAVTFLKITLPYMVFVMTPYLITTFVSNINNFNVIYLLTGGAPESLDYYYAGKTDLLVTWLYKLTIQYKDYNLGSVIGILTFVLMAVFSLLAYRQSGSYKNEEEFQK